MSKSAKSFLYIAVTLVLILGLSSTMALATEAETETVAFINETGYTTLQAAVDAAQAEDTVTLVADVAEVVIFNKPQGASVTIDGDGHSFSGIIYVGDEVNANAVADLTVQNCAFSNRWQHYALELLPGANAVTVENCTAQGYKYGLMRIASSTAAVTVSDTQVRNVSYGAVVEECAFATFRNMTVSNTAYGIAAMNICENTITVDSCTFENVMNPIYVEEMDEAVVQFTFLGITELGMYEVVDEETYESSMEPAGLPESDYAQILAAARIGTRIYEDFPTAAEAVASGQTLTLLADTSVEELAVSTGRTLDLNGWTLAADCFAAFKGANVIDSSIGNTGFLAVAADRAVLPADNTHLPVFNGSGYLFVQILGFDGQQEIAGDGSVSYTLLPYFEAFAHPYLPSGNVNIALRLGWETASGANHRDYTFPAAMMDAVIDSYDAATGTYSQRFNAVLKNTSDIQIKAYLVLCSDTGVEISCPISEERT